MWYQLIFNVLLGNATSAPITGTTAQPVITTGALVTTESMVMLGFKLQQTFTSQLANKSSEEFKMLANQVKKTVSTMIFFIIIVFLYYPFNLILNKIHNHNTYIMSIYKMHNVNY